MRERKRTGMLEAKVQSASEGTLGSGCQNVDYSHDLGNRQNISVVVGYGHSFAPVHRKNVIDLLHKCDTLAS